MRNFWRSVLLMINKVVFYVGVSGRKLFALLLLHGVAFCLLFLVFYLLLVYIPELEAPMTDFSTDELRDRIGAITLLIHMVSSALLVLAFGLVCVATGHMLYWTDDDYYDEKTARKHAAFMKNVR